MTYEAMNFLQQVDSPYDLDDDLSLNPYDIEEEFHLLQYKYLKKQIIDLS